jgi:hypothetical protein
MAPERVPEPLTELSPEKADTISLNGTLAASAVVDASEFVLSSGGGKILSLRGAVGGRCIRGGNGVHLIKRQIVVDVGF